MHWRSVLIRVVTFAVGVCFLPLALWILIRGFWLKGWAVFEVKKRNYPTEILDSPDWEHRIVTANGIKIHCLVAGDGRKPLMLCLHGFPEFSYSWKRQLRHFKDRFTVVAMDLRGYSQSGRPTSCADYALPHLVEDVRAVVSALGFERCAALVGHDWGGVLAYATAARYPDLFQTLTVMNAPYSPLYQANASFEQLFKSWYIFFFQLPFLPELLFRAGDYQIVATMFRQGSKRADAFTDDEIDAFKWSLSQPGAMTAVLNYYRQLFAGNDREIQRKLREGIKIPTLLIWGENDIALSKNLNKGIEKYIPNLTYVPIPDATHWVMCDAPEAVIEAQERFLAEKAHE